MKLVSLAFGICIFLGGAASAQQPKEKVSVSYLTGQSPYVLVDSFQTDMNYLVIDPLKIQSIDVLKDSSAVHRFGAKGRNGVVLIKTKQHTTLLRLPALLDTFSFPNSLRHLRVSINEAIVNNNAMLLIDPSEVESIKTRVMPKWPDARNDEEETFISITVKSRKSNK